jgi:DNA-binding XRE family transcriptional regulator
MKLSLKQMRGAMGKTQKEAANDLEIAECTLRNAEIADAKGEKVNKLILISVNALFDKFRLNVL